MDDGHSADGLPDHVRDLTENLESAVRGGTTPKQWREQLASIADRKLLERVMAAYEERTGRIRTLGEPPSLTDSGAEGWYLGPKEDDTCWPALRDYLLTEKGWDQQTVESIDESSTKIVANLAHPNQKEISTRGLVLGHVQSGKTASFTAVMAKAADAGYRIFIVLSGLHNALRRQTQRRLDRELVDLTNTWLPLTTDERDFSVGSIGKANALFNKDDLCLLIVVKKNHARLDRLLTWLKSANETVLAACPALVIDDEADQASINAAYDEDDRTKINGQILELLDVLPKGAYVGYTATPFANVLVDPRLDDLYPRDFIVDLGIPENYFGASRVFGRDPLTYSSEDGADGLDIIRTVPSDEVSMVRPDPKDRHEFSPKLAPSLETALSYFILASAARRARGQDDEHSTMLVHTSLYVIVHNRFEGLLSDFRSSLLRRVEAQEAVLMSELRELWHEERSRGASVDTPEPVAFDDLVTHLHDVVGDLAIVIENNEAEERLHFGEEPKIQVVVGGNTLSRGLTLEGLVVSYFVRAASAYDTLLQMGRWFGFRTGYEDLPRIWITAELQQHFRDLARVEYEIRRDIERYEEEGRTPRDLAPKIRTHPSLLVTRKMGAAVDANTSYGGDSSQTFRFRHRDEAWLRNNLEAASSLLAGAIASGAKHEMRENERHHLLRGVPSDLVQRFLRDYNFHESHEKLRTDALLNYIEKQRGKGALGKWSVGVIGRNYEPSERTLSLGTEYEFPLIERSRLRETALDKSENADLKAIRSKEDLELDLPIDPSRPNHRPPENGLLLLYPIDRDSQPQSANREPLDAVEDIIGVTLVFPEPREPTAEYVWVQPYLWEQDDLGYVEETIDE